MHSLYFQCTVLHRHSPLSTSRNGLYSYFTNLCLFPQAPQENRGLLIKVVITQVNTTWRPLKYPKYFSEPTYHIYTKKIKIKFKTFRPRKQFTKENKNADMQIEVLLQIAFTPFPGSAYVIPFQTAHLQVADSTKLYHCLFSVQSEMVIANIRFPKILKYFFILPQ